MSAKDAAIAIIGTFVTIALSILAEHHLGVGACVVVVLLGCIVLLWLTGIHKLIDKQFLSLHQLLGIGFVAAVLVLGAALTLPYYLISPRTARTPTFQGPKAGEVRIRPASNLPYVYVPAGTFEMGCSPSDKECECSAKDKNCRTEEDPQHRVTITKGFWIGQTEVTVRGYKSVLPALGKPMPMAPPFNTNWADDDQPMVNVTWFEASQFCSVDNGRLPTEAQWEYAARGRSTAARYGEIDDIAWYLGDSDGQAHDVGRKAPNYLGIYDMLGNVWEWTDDWYDNSFYSRGPMVDPHQELRGDHAKEGDTKVLRGGSASNGPELNRFTNRNRRDPNGSFQWVGFRCVQMQ